MAERLSLFRNCRFVLSHVMTYREVYNNLKEQLNEARGSEIKVCVRCLPCSVAQFLLYNSMDLDLWIVTIINFCIPLNNAQDIDRCMHDIVCMNVCIHVCMHSLMYVPIV